MPATKTKTSPTREQQRVEALSALGFSPTQAFVLAATRRDGEHVEAAQVRRMLDAGCSHETALRILL